METMVKDIAIIISTNGMENALLDSVNSLIREQYQYCGLYIVGNVCLEEKEKRFRMQYNSFSSKCQFIDCKWNGDATVFSEGIKEAIKDGYKYLWLLQEGMKVHAGSLEKLIYYDQKLNGEYGFLASAVLDGKELYKRYQPLIDENIVWSKYNQLELKLFPVECCAFSGLFFHSCDVENVGLPISSMNVGYDGYEFTKRLGEIKNGYFVVDSCVEYCVQDNIQYDICIDDNVEIYKYVYRNDLYLARKKGLKYIGFYFFRFIKAIVDIVARSKNKKWYRLEQIMLGTLMGLVYHPQIEKMN